MALHRIELHDDKQEPISIHTFVVIFLEVLESDKSSQSGHGQSTKSAHGSVRIALFRDEKHEDRCCE